MASLERDRILRFGWGAARYALGPIAGILTPWLVIHRGSLAEWGSIQTTMILVQLAAHITQWGNRDHLLRGIAAAPERELELWRGSMITRAVPWVLCALVLTRGDLIEEDAWAMAWLLGLVVANNMEPLIIWRRLFGPAFLADALGLASQIIVLLLVTSIDSEVIAASFGANQVVRSLVLWAALRFPSFRPAYRLFNAREHLWNALPFFLTGFSGLLASRIDLYTANALLDRPSMAHYQIVTSVFLQFQGLAGLIIMPMRRNIYRLEMDSVARYTTRLRTWAALALLPMCALAWAVFSLLFHFETDLRVIAVGGLLVWPVFAYVPLIDRLYKAGRERTVMWANFAAAFLSCALAWLLLPTCGIAGGLLGAAAGQWLMLFWITNTARRLHALP